MYVDSSLQSVRETMCVRNYLILQLKVLSLILFSHLICPDLNFNKLFRHLEEPGIGYKKYAKIEIDRYSSQ